MRSECIQAVSRALGRNATGTETNGIENRIRIAMRRLAAEDPAGWQQLTSEEKLNRAGDAAAHEITHEAALKRHRTALSILAHDRVQNYIEAQVASGADPNRIMALRRLLEGKSDGKNNATSAWSIFQGTMSTASTFLTKSWNVAGGKFLHLLRDKAAEWQLVKALHGDKSVDKTFQQAAADFHTVAERLRNRFNAAGGDIGKLENWGMPHSWSVAKLLSAGKAKWTESMFGRMDRSKYVHDDGTPYSDTEMRDFLGNAWTSVVTNGANKVLGGERPTGGLKANRGSAERQIHLKGAQEYMDSMGNFSDRGVLDTMLGHIRQISRDISMVEQFGPNPDLLFKQALDQAHASEAVADPTKTDKLTGQAKFATRVYNYMAGNSDSVPATWYGSALQGWRNLNLLKLGGVAINSIGDYGTMHLTAAVNGVSHTKMFLNELSALNPANKSERAMAASAGLMMREYSQTLSRFGGDVGAHGWTSKLGNTVLKVSLAPYAWAARQRAFSYGMMDQVGAAVRDFDDITKLNDEDQKFIKHSGLSNDDWQIMRMAEPEDWGGNHTLLTPDSIYQIPDAKIAALTNEDPSLVKDRTASNMMGLVYSEQDRAILEPGPTIKVALGGDMSPDTPVGMLARSFSLFKTYSFDLTYQHLTRALKSYDTKAGSVGYLAALIASTTVCGATINAIDSIIHGQNPSSLNLTNQEGWKNWLSAMVKGGGLGLYGDFLINTYGSRGNTLAETLLGPIVSDASSIVNAVQQTVAHSTDPDADLAKKLHSPAVNAMQTVKGYVPGANLWYSRAVLDRLIFNQIADYISPGYLDRMKAKARQQGHSNWWQPDEAVPSAAPDPSTIAQ